MTKYMHMFVDIFNGAALAALTLFLVSFFFYVIGAVAAVVAVGFMHTYYTLI